MKNLYAAFFSILLFPFFSAAQNNYKPGYMVTLKGDTLRGIINCKTGYRNPVQFTFKDSLNSSRVRTFTAGTARAFAITGDEIYKSFVVDISQDKLDVGSASTPLRPVKDTVFLNLIDSGRYVTLYRYADKIKERFFVNEKNTNPVELTLHVYPDPYSTTEMIRQEIYKRQLQTLAVKYLPQFQSVIAEAQEAAYTREAIEKIVFEINGSDSNITFTSTKKNKWRPLVGIGFNAMSVHNFAKVDPTATTQQSGSVELNFGEDVFINEEEKSMIMRIELHGTYSGSNTITAIESGYQLEQYHTITLSFNPQFLFAVYNSDGTKIYLGAGVQAFLLAGAKASYIAPTFDDQNPPGYYSFNFILTTRADIVLNNKLDIYAGYSPPARLEQNTLSAFRAGLSYLFGVK